MITPKPYSFETSFRILSPSRPKPWKSYGDVRGLYAPPRISFNPFSWIVAATAATCSYDSTAHGPNTKEGAPVPINSPLTLMTVSSDFSLRETSNSFSFLLLIV